MSRKALVGLLAVSGLAQFAAADIVAVDAKSAIFDAGRDAPTLDGQLPPMLALPDGAASMNVTEVLGIVRAHPVLQWGGPDGNFTTANDSDIASYQGISGFIHPGTLPLVAVFLSDEAPQESAPARLDFNSIGSNFASLSPEIGQTFFVGNGWTDGGVLQEFVVPTGATRVFFGLADAGFFTGEPTGYADNEGAFAADVSFNVVPAPGSIALLGFGGLIATRRRR
ncbi:MAG: PEP-CTERM sorting domain-containing protein [Planctomycetota bacterium]|nr:PEP-CTERM sorting domain-containing protein [Planctomycetota bacterium]